MSMWQRSRAHAQSALNPTRALIVPETAIRPADGNSARPETDRESRLHHNCQNLKDETEDLPKARPFTLPGDTHFSTSPRVDKPVFWETVEGGGTPQDQTRGKAEGIGWRPPIGAMEQQRLERKSASLVDIP